MTVASLIPIVTQVVILAVAGFVGYWVFVVKATNRISVIETRCAQHVLMIARMEELSREHERMKADNLVFWRVIEPHLGQIIHSPVNVERDALVEKLIDGSITHADEGELSDLLRKALGDESWPAEKRLAASLLLARLVQRQGSRRDDPC